MLARGAFVMATVDEVDAHLRNSDGARAVFL
jgi:hypothetical protein